MHTRIHSHSLISVAILGVLASVCFVFIGVAMVHGQESTGSTIGTEADRLEVDVSAAPVETNVCDGVTCSDGSCAATIDECGATPAAEAELSAPVLGDDLDENDETFSAEPVSASDGDSDGDGLDDGVERANYNNSRSNKSVIRDPDSDNDGLDDGTERANYNNSRSNRSTVSGSAEALDTDSDGDGLDDGTEGAQNQNSSRSNRTQPAAPDHLDPDDDGDGVPTRAADGELDKASPLLFEFARGDDDDDGDGISDPRMRADDGGVESRAGYMKIKGIDGEVEDTETGEQRLRRVHVSGADVRQWSEEEREAFVQMRGALATGTPQYASARVAQAVLDDERIESIELNGERSHMEYRAQLRWLGFIPTERVVTAKTEESGEVVIDYPWYSFLATTPDTEVIRDTISEIKIEILMTMTADPI